MPRSLLSSLAGGAEFAASWFVGQVMGGAGGNVAAAAGWERATVKMTEGISLLRGLSPRPASALRQREADMDESLRERERRAARNQLLFREVNERIASLAERALLPEVAPIEVTCECVDTSCTRTVQIPLHDFAEIDRATNRFLVVPGHELPDVEDVVERRDRFLIVAKRGAGADLVEQSAKLTRRIELRDENANSTAA